MAATKSTPPLSGSSPLRGGLRRRRSGRPRFPFSLGTIVVALLLILVLDAILDDVPRGHRILYKEFRDAVAEGRVKQVTLGEEIYKGTLVETAADGTTRDARFTVEVGRGLQDPDLVKVLQEKGVDYTGDLDPMVLRRLSFWLLPLAFVLFVWALLSRRTGRGVGPVLSFGRSGAKLIGEDEVKVTFRDVAGVEEAKEELQEIIGFLRDPRRYQRLGGKIPKGVLLVGPPGTGKTLLARAVAGEARVSFFSISGSEFVEMFVGVGAARVRDLFKRAVQKAPAIIFIDELDALGKARGLGPVAMHDEREQTLNQLLVEMDGFETKRGVVLMAATNRPEILDSALLRPGRFDRQVLVDRPDLDGREAILGVHVRGVRLAGEVALRQVAAQTAGFAGADLAHIVNEAALLAARRDASSVETRDFEEAIDRVVAGLEKKRRVMNVHEKRIVAYHESGHALVASRVAHADPVRRISIVPRGIAALGFTMQQPAEDRYLLTRTELLDRLAVLLGGRTAERVVFGEVSTGAQNDLVEASGIARSMVTEYGMSEQLGAVSFDRPRRSPLESLRHTERGYSEETARRIDAEVRAILDETVERVRGILVADRDGLERVAKALLEKEAIEGDEFRAILAGRESPGTKAAPAAPAPGRAGAPRRAGAPGSTPAARDGG